MFCEHLELFHRYIPAVEESVIGIITQKYGENFDVDIGGPFTATLPVLAFEGATRRNRPNLQVCNRHISGMPTGYFIHEGHLFAA